MKLSINEFVERQNEFEGHKIKFIAEWNDGSIKTFERVVNDKFCVPNTETFKILEVEILEHIGIIKYSDILKRFE